MHPYRANAQSNRICATKVLDELPQHSLGKVLSPPIVRKQVALQLLVSNLYTVITFVLTVILARLLTPEDIGVFSMSAVLMAVAHVFRDFGVTAYLKREKEITDQTIRTAKGLLYLTSCSMAAIMFLSAPAWASFYREPRVEEVIHVLALGFLFIPFGSIPFALIGREMDVEKHAKVAITSVAVYFLVSILFALWGFGHMTMAWANLVNILFSGLANNLMLGRRLPFWPSLRGWRQMADFGLANVITSLAKAINTSLPDIVLGRIANANQVGLFSRANATVTMTGKVIEGPINFFTLPYMARVHHASGDIGKTYLRIASIINTIMVPPLIWTGLLADDIVLLLFGPKWINAAPAIPWLCVAVGISTLFSISTQTMIGVGRPWATLMPLFTVILGKLLAVILLFDGTLASFATAMAAGEAASIPIYLLMIKKHLSIRLGDWITDLAKIAIIALVVWGVLAGLGELLEALNAGVMLRITLTALATACTTIITSLVLDLPLGSELTRIGATVLRFTIRNQ